MFESEGGTIYRPSGLDRARGHVGGGAGEWFAAAGDVYALQHVLRLDAAGNEDSQPPFGNLSSAGCPGRPQNMEEH